MIATRPDLPLLVALLSALLLIVSCDAADAGRKKREEKKEAIEVRLPGSGNCKAPAASSPRLAEGLEKYLEGDWTGALGPLSEWGATENAASDPAAGRGFYSLAYAHAATRQDQKSQAWYDRAEPLLVSSSEQAPNLEDLYYLASLHRTRNDPARQLATVSKTLALLEGGQVCPATDGDDDFRISRLLSFAGREDERRARLAQAVVKYGEGQGRVTTYHALALQELGEQARRDGDVADWERLLRRAAALDPTIPSVHRNLGLAILKRGAIEDAAEYWRAHWREERSGGNSLIYAVRVLQANVGYRARFGDQHLIGNIGEYTKEALEQNAVFESKAMAAAAAKLGAELSDSDAEAARLEHDLAHYRLIQLLTAYLAREMDLQEFALQNGLLPAIHGAGLPKH